MSSQPLIPPSGFICSRAASEPLEHDPRAFLSGSAVNYKFLLGKALFMAYETKQPISVIIPRIPLHLVSTITSVYVAAGVSVHYTIATSRTRDVKKPSLQPEPVISDAAIDDLLKGWDGNTEGDS